MNLFRVKPGKDLLWPAAFTPVPEKHEKTLTRRGRARYLESFRVVRATGGFVVDMDAPGEEFFVSVDQFARMEPVPRSEYETAAKEVEAQGPVDFQPALDWLDDQGIRQKVARPADVAPVEEDGPASWDRDRLRTECDRLGIEVGQRRTETLRREVIEGLEAEEAEE